MDVVILGGGIVGLVIANLLATQTKLKITLIESRKFTFDLDAIEYDLRCSAVNRATEQVLQSLQIWDNIVAHRVGVYQKMYIWDAETKAELSFNATECGEENLGHIVENGLLQHWLWQKLYAAHNVTILHAEPIDIELHQNTNRIFVGGKSIDATLVIGADGANSWLRHKLNIPVLSKKYTQTALVATIKSTKTHNQTAMQCFTIDGPLAFLPLSDPYLSSIVWSNTPANVQNLLALDAKDFCNALANAFQHKLGELELCGERAAFPLQIMHAKNYIAPRVALLGDAIHVVHPLAGQGLNMGIKDAITLANILQSVSDQKHDIGAQHVLRKYERWRKGDNLTTLASVDAIKRAFAINNPTLVELRNLGLSLINKSKWIKRNLVKNALGLSSNFAASTNT